MASCIGLSLNRDIGTTILCGYRRGLDSLLETSRLRGWSQICAALNARRVSSVPQDSGVASSSGPTPLATQGPYYAQVKSRGVLRLEGPDVFKFLQGLVTNDVTRLERDPSATLGTTPSPLSAAAIKPPLYSAILNPQGRFLYDLFLYRPTHPTEHINRTGSGPRKGDDGLPYLLADVDAAVVDELVSHLTKYRLRAKVSFENISSDLKVWQGFGGSNSSRVSIEGEAGSIGYGGSVDKSAQITDESDGRSWLWYKDPRLPELGLRGVFPSNSVPPLVTSDEEVSEEYYLLWRLEQGVAEGTTEIPKGEAIPLEFNLAGLNAISFDKGCYVGQELVARTHHRGVIRKRIMPADFIQEDGKEVQQEVIPGVEVLDMISKKKVGKVTTVLGPRGLALMRLDSALKASSQLKLDVPQKNIYLKLRRPNWWPGEWGMNHRQETAAND